MNHIHHARSRKERLGFVFSKEEDKYTQNTHTSFTHTFLIGGSCGARIHHYQNSRKTLHRRTWKIGWWLDWGRLRYLIIIHCPYTIPTSFDINTTPFFQARHFNALTRAIIITPGRLTMAEFIETFDEELPQKHEEFKVKTFLIFHKPSHQPTQNTDVRLTMIHAD